MKCRLFYVISVFVFFSALSSVAYSKETLTDKYNRLLKRHGLTSKEVSISVQKRINLKQWQPFFEANAEAEMTPASLTKILTALAAFEVYPPNYQFLTELKTTGTISGGVLNGDLYLVGSGDPTLVTEKLWLLVHELQRLNIQKVTGNLIYDASVFDEVKFSPTRSTKNHRAYSAPVSGLSYNWNSLFIRIFPTTAGQKARVYIDPPDASIRLRNNSVTGKRTKLLVDRVSTSEYDSVIVAGSIAENDEYGVYRSHTQPSRRAAHQAMALLTNYGVKVEGTIKSGTAPSTASTLAKIESVGLDEIVKMMMKFSNNFIAEMLTKKMDAIKNNRQGTLKGGIKVIEDVLKLYSTKKVQITNPSGLSVDNKISSSFLTDVLTKALAKSTFNSEFVSTFARSGIDGTLKKRMTRATGHIRGKTGLLNGVVGLAGYMDSKSGQEYAFSMIYNGPIKKQGRATDFFDLLSETIVLTY